MKKLALFIAAIVAVPAMIVGSAFAETPGQLEGGSNVYAVKNITQNGQYGSSATVTACGDVMQFSIMLHNTEYGALYDINVKSTLGSTSTATATPSVASAGVSGTVSVNGLTDEKSLSYVNGSTKLYDGNGNVVKTLADGITTTGVNAGDLEGSATEYVNFQAKVNCPTTPPTKPHQIKVCEIDTKKVVTINESDFDSSKYAKDLSACEKEVTTVTELPHTGPTNGVFVAVGLAAITAGAAYFVQRRKILG